MSKGRKPKPLALQLIEGEKNKDRINDAQPKPRPVAPKVPKELSPVAKKHYKKISETLERLGVLTEIDGAALFAYCAAYGRWIEAEQTIKEKGLLYKSPAGAVGVSPMVRIANQAIDQMMKIASEFGMTPASRTKIKVDADDDDDEF